MTSADQADSGTDARNMLPPDATTPLIEAYLKDIDRTVLRENLKLTPEQRAEKFLRGMRLVFELRRSRPTARTDAS